MLCFLVIISMYGGGFATVPAYLKDMFGTRYVGAIHGLSDHRLVDGRHLRAGPRQLYSRIQHRSRSAEGAGLQRDDVHHGGLLFVGFLCNLLIKAVNSRFHMQPQDEGGALSTAAAAGAERAAQLTGKTA